VVELRHRRRFVYVTLALVFAAAGLARHALVIIAYSTYRPLMIAWTVAFAFSALQWVLSWWDKPYKVSRSEQARLDRMRVTVNIPVYNEDPELLDRCLYSIVSQTRPPNRIDVIDDGSTVDYRLLAKHWSGIWPKGVKVHWVRQRNGGKKHAQAATFTSDPYADVFVTIDSDTALEPAALEEGLKPFADPRVQSVAGIELAFNSRANWLTRTVSARSLFFQIVACGAQSVSGNVLVNRGAYALYRGDMIRRIVPAYLGETFMGRRVRLGDDAALTLFARGCGRAVQQPTAFALTMYPEKLSHHYRQWLRWMRGSTIRNFWRLRYLPIYSYGWWFTVLGIQTFLASTLLPVIVVLTWPRSEMFAIAGGVAMLSWGYLTSLRILSIRRSDEGWWYRLGTLLSYPTAMIWSTFILRPIRFLGIATCLRQGWTTRTEGVEVAITPAAGEVSA
jgi:hyaluronan synthase